MAESPRYPVRKLGCIEHTGGKHRVSRSQTSTDNECSLEVGFQQQVDKYSGNEPTECHDGTEHHSHARPVPLEVFPWQLNPNGKYLDRQYDPGGLLGDVVCPSPAAWVDQVKAFRPEDDADKRR